MVSAATDITVQVGGPQLLDDNTEPLLAVYREVYTEKVASDPFFSEARYWERVLAYATRDGYTLAVGQLDEQIVAYAMGCTLPAGSKWWAGLLDPLDDPDFGVEDGIRTWALTYMMVREPYRRRGYARALHDGLLHARPEPRAALLVLPDNTPARTAYLNWGWQIVGRLQPYSDAPIYDAMVLDLMR